HADTPPRPSAAAWLPPDCAHSARCRESAGWLCARPAHRPARSRCSLRPSLLFPLAVDAVHAVSSFFQYGAVNSQGGAGSLFPGELGSLAIASLLQRCPPRRV